MNTMSSDRTPGDARTTRTPARQGLGPAIAFTAGAAGAVSALGVGVVLAEAHLARKVIGTPYGLAGPRSTGVYLPTRLRDGGPAGPHDLDGAPGPAPVLHLAMIGDSAAVGLGVDHGSRTPGAVVAAGLADLLDAPVRFTNVAVVGAQSHHLAEQVELLLSTGEVPDVTMAIIGGNDVTARNRVATAVRHEVAAARRLLEAGSEVVVGTCPDLGSIEPLKQPLRTLARHWSRQLAQAQIEGLVAAGASAVSLGEILGPEFERSRELFSDDRFHPSAVGYARVAAVMLPTVCTAAGVPLPHAEPAADPRRGEGVDDVRHAARRAVAVAGTEVAPTSMAGTAMGPRGPWAFVRTRLPLHDLAPRLELPKLPPLQNLDLPRLPELPRLADLPVVADLQRLASQHRTTPDAARATAARD